VRWLLVVLLLGGVAHAQPSPKQRADAAFAAAREHYAAGDYAAAARDFEAAYALDPDPAYLFNIAQAYRFAHDCAAAGRNYQRFLAEVPDAPNREKVIAYLTEMNSCAEQQARPPSLQAPPPPPAPPPAPPPVAPRADHRRAGLLLAAGGAVALGVGVMFHRDVHVLEGYREDLCAGQVPCDWTPERNAQAADYDARGRRASIIAIGAYSAGALAVVGGAALYLRSPREARRVTIAPLHNGGAVASVGFSF